MLEILLAQAIRVRQLGDDIWGAGGTGPRDKIVDPGPARIIVSNANEFISGRSILRIF
jgi:hypothetical protein